MTLRGVLFSGVKVRLAKRVHTVNVSSQQLASPSSWHFQPTSLSLTTGKAAEL